MNHTIPLEIVELEEGNFHVFVELSIKGEKARLLIDTGASKTVFDAERVLRFAAATDIEDGISKSVGLGADQMDTRLVKLKRIQFRKLKLKKLEVAVLPMQHVNNTYSMLGLPMIDGVLGSDFLVKHDAVIHFRKAKLTLYKD